MTEELKLKVVNHIGECIESAPTGGHWDMLWWRSRYTDIQIDRQMRRLPLFPGYSLEEYFACVYGHFESNEMATAFLKDSERDLK
jgi:hypothetical protein